MIKILSDRSKVVAMDNGQKCVEVFDNIIIAKCTDGARYRFAACDKKMAIFLAHNVTYILTDRWTRIQEEMK
jgi:hypothetical protein